MANLIADYKDKIRRTSSKKFLRNLKTQFTKFVFTSALISFITISGLLSNTYSKTSTHNEISTRVSLPANPTVHRDYFYEENSSIIPERKNDYTQHNEASSQACIYSWSSQTSGTANQLLTVSAVSDLIGWAGGVNSTVRKTTDGGSTWANAAGTGIRGDVYNIYGIDGDNALCTTSPDSTFIFKTTNGGATWSKVFFQTPTGAAFIDAIRMISATDGYAIGDPVGGKWTILKTTDGGNTWNRMATEPAPIGAETGFNNSFYILGNHMWFGTNMTRVYHSTDLGLTWSTAPTTGTANTFAVHYNTESLGLASGLAIVRSTNGGANYTSAASPGSSGSISGIDGRGNDWWAIRTGASIYRSTDHGASWNTAHTQAGAVFQYLDFATSGDCPSGWAVGDGGVIAKMAATTGIINYNNEIPVSYELGQNFPNPFNPSTNLRFSIPKSGLIVLKVYDMNGREVAVLVNEFHNAGNYVVGFSASNFPSGVYFYRVTSGNFTDTKKMLLIK